MKPIIEIQGLGKQYKIGGKKQPYLSLRESLTGVFKERNGSEENTIWALKDIDFKVYPGDSVGIIGPNGAGKSTLLKILSKITPPTEGKIIARGRVASLLEVGTGFHPELTGRENIFLNGSILGLRRFEIASKFDEIVDFSGVEKFLDTPLKHYSSGMQLRLAFAVAAHLEPEILVIDEVLAVGDAEFQKKCLGKMEEVSRGGRTVMFVSHNMQAVQNLCRKAIWLDNGNQRLSNNSEIVVRKYLTNRSNIENIRLWKKEDMPGNEVVKLESVRIEPLNRHRLWESETSLEIQICLFYLGLKGQDIDVTIHLRDEMNNVVFVSSSAYSIIDSNLVNGKYLFKAIVDEGILHEGTYRFSRLIIIAKKGQPMFELSDCLTFELFPKQKNFIGWQEKKEGIIAPQGSWEINRI